MTDLLPDAVLGVLLLTTTVWCALVHHRLRRLRTDRGEMAAFVAALTTASERAETAIAGLREAAAETDRKLTQQAESTRQRGSELVRLLESGTRLARRLETSIGQGARTLAAETPREQRPAWQTGERPAPERPPPERQPASRAASAPSAELLRALETLR